MPKFLDVTDTAAARAALGATSTGSAVVTAADEAAARTAINAVGRDAQVIDFRDHGMIGDGTSRPLSTLFGSLEAAQAVYPAARALTDELDWAVMQSVADANPGGSFLVPSTAHAITNRGINVSDFSVWTVDGIIENIWPHNAPTNYQDRAKIFNFGNIHPRILKTSNADSWAAHGLNNVTKGSRTVTVTTPAGLPSLTVGDKVIVRSSTGELDVGVTDSAVLYDFVQFNKVVAYDPATGVVTLELPLGESVGTAGPMTGPTLCVNTGAIDGLTGLPWSMLDGFELRGNGTVIGRLLSNRTGLWRCRIRMHGMETQQLCTLNAAVRSHIDVSGTFTNRCMEIKMASWESTIIVDGVFKPETQLNSGGTIPDKEVTCTIGEQSTGINLDLRCYRGTDFTDNLNMFEDQGIRNTVRAELFDYSTGGTTGMVHIRSTSFVNRPPSDSTYDLYIRTSGGQTRYVNVGLSDAGFGHPRRIRWRVNAKSDGAVPTYLDQVQNGTFLVRGDSSADVVRGWTASTSIEAPENAPIVVATVTTPLTYPANTDTFVGSYTFAGVLSGDHVESSLQVLATPSSGTFGDLIPTATVSGGSTVRVYVRNRSGTDVVFGAGNLYRLYLRWQRHRV